MFYLTIALGVVLMAIAALHILWGIGFWVPIRDEAALTRAVLGAKGRNQMPGAIACSLVAIALLGAAWVLWWPPLWFRDLALFCAGTVFGLRGMAAYIGRWRRMFPVEPFATLDRRLYGPLCLLLGAGFIVQLLA